MTHQQSAWLDEMRSACRLCPRECGAARRHGETGWCGLDDRAWVYDDFVHHGEGAGLAPSFTVFLLGCNLGCRYCYTADERRQEQGVELTPARLSSMMAEARRWGAKNLNFIGGEPTMSLPALVRVLDACPTTLPLVWNTSGYATAAAFAALTGRVGTWLVDHKVGNDDCAEAVLGARDYLQVCRARLLELYNREPERLVVRHLVMPGHLECCVRPTLEWIAHTLPGVRCNLLLNYTVTPAARDDRRLARFLTRSECDGAVTIATDLGIELEAASSGLVDGALPALGNLNGDTRQRNAEIVISPTGAIHIRQPTAALVEAVQSAVLGENR